MTNVGHIMGPLNRWALSKPLPIRRDIHFPEHFPLRMQIWTVFAKVTKVFRSNLAKSSDCKLGWQNSSKTASGRLNMKVIGSWKQRSGGRVREGESFSCKKIFVPTAVPKKVHAAVTFCTNGVETGKICPSLHTFPSKHRKIFEEMFETNNKRARNLSKMAKKRGRTVQHQ